MIIMYPMNLCAFKRISRILKPVYACKLKNQTSIYITERIWAHWCLSCLGKLAQNLQLTWIWII